MRGPRPDRTSCGVSVEEGTRCREVVEGGVGSTKVGMFAWDVLLVVVFVLDLCVGFQAKAEKSNPRRHSLAKASPAFRQGDLLLWCSKS